MASGRRNVHSGANGDVKRADRLPAGRGDPKHGYRERHGGPPRISFTPVQVDTTDAEANKRGVPRRRRTSGSETRPSALRCASSTARRSGARLTAVATSPSSRQSKSGCRFSGKTSRGIGPLRVAIRHRNGTRSFRRPPLDGHSESPLPPSVEASSASPTRRRFSRTAQSHRRRRPTYHGGTVQAGRRRSEATARA